MHHSFGISLTNKKNKKILLHSFTEKASRDSMKGASPSGKS